MISTPYRNIPQTMGTQHPDNANAPYWESDGDGFVSTQEEVKECASAFQDLGCEEYMWDWEGKHVDEGVMEKLLVEHYDFFSKHPLGKERFLTFRIPNIWEEKGRSLARAFMNILTSEEFARDLGLHTPPLFEIILPMTDRAEKLIHMQKTFTQLAHFKHRLFADRDRRFTYVEMIPLVEGVSSMIKIQELLRRYVVLHQQYYKRRPHALRVFLARSDPALISGIVPAVVGNKIALSELYQWSSTRHIPVYPWLGAGSLPFRGHLRPDRITHFLRTYPGIRSVTIQSSFRYDFPLSVVKRGIRELNQKLSKTTPVLFSKAETKRLQRLIPSFERPYQQSIFALRKTLHTIASCVPSRRERRLHIGLLGYGRKMGSISLPRAIPFTAAFYSLGVPPELIGTGRGIASLSRDDLSLLEKHYITLREDLRMAGEYLNRENLEFLARTSRAFRSIKKDVEVIESYLGSSLGPSAPESFIHRNWTSTLFFERKNRAQMSAAIRESAKIRHSLG